jgi:hypothetical protein
MTLPARKREGGQRVVANILSDSITGKDMFL